MSRRKRILIVSHICPYPPNSGVQTRIDQTLEWLKGEGFEILYLLQGAGGYPKESLMHLKKKVHRLFYSKKETLPEITKRQMRRLLGKSIKAISPYWYEKYRTKPVEVARDELSFVELESFCWKGTQIAARKILRKYNPSYILSEHAFFSECLDGAPQKTLRVLDTHELFSQGHSRLKGEKKLEQIAVCTEENEKRALSRADVLIAIQKNDFRILKSWFPDKKTILMPVWHGERFSKRVHFHSEGQRILYVAASNPYNNHGLEKFLEEVWPNVLKDCPQVELRIVGSVQPPSLQVSPEVIFLGRVSDEKLQEEYQKATLVINPQQAGTGLKIKCVEALSQGCVLVTYPAGAEGLEEGIQEGAFWVAKNSEDFREKMVKLVRDPDLRLVTQNRAKAFAKQSFSKESVFKEFKEILGDSSMCTGL